MKLRQGRFAEAEVDARRALLSRLKDQGKYNPGTPRFVMGLADILVEQGRYAEAEQLARVCLEINRTVGVADDSQSTVQLLSQLGGILNLQRKAAKRWRSMRRSTRRSRLGAATAADLRTQRFADHRAVCVRPARCRHRRRRTTGQKADRTGRRQSFRYRVGARHARHRPDARGQGRRCDPRVQGRDTGPAGGIARECRRRRHHRRRRAQPAAAGHRRGLSDDAGAGEKSGRRCRRRDLQPRGCDPRPFGAAGAGRVQRPQRGHGSRRWPNWCARSRTSASRSTRSSAP